jgi:hypothetical protein
MRSMGGTRDALAAIDAVLHEQHPDPAPALQALAGLPDLRAHLDVLEAAAIDAARRSGAGWDDIAAALGLRSRQAAEQRRLRLASPSTGLSEARITRRRREETDHRAGTAAATLRLAVRDLALRLDDAPVTPPIRLARDTLRLARDADPGPLVDLARQAVRDLEREPVETPVAAALQRLRTALLSVIGSRMG